MGSYKEKTKQTKTKQNSFNSTDQPNSHFFKQGMDQYSTTDGPSQCLSANWCLNSKDLYGTVKLCFVFVLT